MIPVESGELDVLVAGRDGVRTVATLHPIESMHEALPLLAEVTDARVVCVNPRGVGHSSPHRDVRDATIDGMAADLDQVRQALGFRRWVIWGMSGGGVVAMASARWHPDGIPALMISPREPSVQMRRVMSSLLAFDARPWLAAIDAPTLVLAGAADQVVPLAHLRALHEAIPGASLAVIDGAGHVPITDRPDDV